MTADRPPEGEQEERATPRETEPRPDQRGPRGNPEAESADVERGVEKLDRVITK